MHYKMKRCSLKHDDTTHLTGDQERFESQIGGFFLTYETLYSTVLILGLLLNFGQFDKLIAYRLRSLAGA